MNDGKLKIYLFQGSRMEEELIRNVRERFPSRYEKSSRLRQESGRMVSLAATHLLYAAAGIESEQDLLYGSSGKPYCKNGPCFNLSHSGEYAAIVVDEDPAGLDIQLKRHLSDAVLRKICTASEMEWVMQDQDMRSILLWTMKEGILKADGRGISVDLRDICCMPFLNGEPVNSEGIAYYGTYDWFGQYACCACTTKSYMQLEIVDLSAKA